MYIHPSDLPPIPSERVTVLPKSFWASLVAAVIAGVLWASDAFAAPVFVAQVEGIRITLTDEKCNLPEVSNLPMRATWEEKGKVFEGCVGAVPPLGVFMFYFKDDKTVAAVPMQQFERVVGI